MKTHKTYCKILIYIFKVAGENNETQFGTAIKFYLNEERTNDK